MKSLFILLITLTFLSPAYAAPKGLKITYDYEASGERKTHKGTGTYFLTEGATRVEMDQDISGSNRGPMAIIQQTNPKKRLILDLKGKTYTDVTAFMGDSSIPVKQDKEPPFKSTGKKKKIAKHTCVVVERTHRGTHEEACISKSLAKEFAMLSRAFSGSKKRRSFLPNGLDGFPLEFISRGKSEGSNSVMRVREITQQRFGQQLFQVPQNFTANVIPTGVPNNQAGAAMNDSVKMKSTIDAMMKGGQSPAEREKMKMDIQKMAEEMKKKYQQK
jgi:hypothetical protein